MGDNARALKTVQMRSMVAGITKEVVVVMAPATVWS